MAGYGSGGYGSDPYAGPAPGGDPELSETLTLSESVSVDQTLILESVVVLSPHDLELTFNHDLDTGDSANTDATNFIFSPSQTVVSVTFQTDNQLRIKVNGTGFTAGINTVTLSDLVTPVGDVIHSPNNVGGFSGYGVSRVLTAAAQGPRKVMLTFSVAMTVDAAFTEPTNYYLQLAHGDTQIAGEGWGEGAWGLFPFGGVTEEADPTDIAVLSVVAQGEAPVTRATLTLAEDLTPGVDYRIIVGPAVTTSDGYTLAPPTVRFRWSGLSAVARGRTLTLPVSRFSGEVSGGLHGTPAGQVFFSPALQTAVPNSTIRVDQISACTKAYDTYTIPSLPDPNAFMLWSPHQTSSFLNDPTAVLWAPPHLLGLAQFDLEDFHEDTVPTPDDTESVSFVETSIVAGVGGYLNDPNSTLFNGTSGTFMLFDPAGGVGTLTVTRTITPAGTAHSVTWAPVQALEESVEAGP